MARKEPKRLPRGAWDSADGRILLGRIRRKEITPKEAGEVEAPRLWGVKVSESGIYNAMSKRMLRQATTPIEADPSMDRLLASVQEFLGEAVTVRLKALERQATEATARAEAAERELETLRNKNIDLGATLDSFRRGVAEKVDRGMRESHEARS